MYLRAGRRAGGQAGRRVSGCAGRAAGQRRTNAHCPLRCEQKSHPGVIFLAGALSRDGAVIVVPEPRNLAEADLERLVGCHRKCPRVVDALAHGKQRGAHAHGALEQRSAQVGQTPDLGAVRRENAHVLRHASLGPRQRAQGRRKSPGQHGRRTGNGRDRGTGNGRRAPRRRGRTSFLVKALCTGGKP